MTATSRELVHQTLRFQNPPRAPRQLWVLPWAAIHHPKDLASIQLEFPDDIGGVSGHLREFPKTHGNPYEVGEFVDEWGSISHNIQPGVIGEVKIPLIGDWEQDAGRVHIPAEWLTLDRDLINRDCDATDRFVMAGCCPRPFEQMQFLRGSENLYVDLAQQQQQMMRFLHKMHAFYCDLLTAWAKTNVDALMFMDDWGSQRQLLIRPALWRDLFKPLYRDYAQIAHSHGKRIFMHSDGHILAIYPELVELGIDAVNSQLFCMGIENLEAYAGKITFWGEIDRQNLLPNGSVEDIVAAVDSVHHSLWRNGGCIAQCEFGAGALPQNVRTVYKRWNELATPAS